MNKPTKKAPLLVSFVFSMVWGISQPSSFKQDKNPVFASAKRLNSKYDNGLRAQAYTSNKDVSDDSDFLEVIGNFDSSAKELSGIYTAKLILDNTVIEEQILNVRKPLTFMLKKDMLYSIKVEKEGYVSKTIHISTKSSALSSSKNSYLFKFQANLLNAGLMKQLDDNNVNFPLALITYNKDCDCFEQNKE